MASSTFLVILWKGGGAKINSHIVQAGLELKSSCLYLSSAVTAGVDHHWLSLFLFYYIYLFTVYVSMHARSPIIAGALTFWAISLLPTVIIYSLTLYHLSSFESLSNYPPLL